MSADLIMPKLGLNMTEGQLASWRVGPGDKVARGDVLFTVETDKIAIEVEAVSDGEIVDIIVPEGQIVPVGAPVARWTGGPAIESPIEAVDQPAAPSAQSTASPPSVTPRTGTRIIATPYARRRAAELGVELATVGGSGPRGRIKAADVERAAGQAAPQIVETSAAIAAETTASDVYWISADVDIGPSTTLVERLGVGVSAVVVAATACAYGGPVVFIENGEARLFPATHSLRLGDIASGVDAEVRVPLSDERAGAVCASQTAARFGPALVMDTVFSLGVAEVRQIGANGASAHKLELTLTLSARSAAMTLGDAESLLDRIKDIVETPALLLLGRVS
jgi:hypothetical protein